MIGLSEKTLLAASIIFSTFAPQSTPSASPSDFLVPREYVYVVVQGDSLSSIAKDKYGSSDYWTTIWKDNDWIENPNIIYSDWKINIRFEKPVITEQLPQALQGRQASLGPQSVIVTSGSIPSQSFSAVGAGATGQLSEEQIAFLGNCESGMRPDTNTGNGFYGAFQFTIGTWNNMNTGYERADMAPLDVQKEAVQRLLSRSSIYAQFPACARNMHAGGLI